MVNLDNLQYPVMNYSFEGGAERSAVDDRINRYITSNPVFWIGLGVSLAVTSIALAVFVSPVAVIGLIPSAIFILIGSFMHVPADPNEEEPDLVNDVQQRLGERFGNDLMREIQEDVPVDQEQLARERPSVVALQERVQDPETRRKVVRIMNMVAMFPFMENMVLNNLPMEQADKDMIHEIIESYRNASGEQREALQDALQERAVRLFARLSEADAANGLAQLDQFENHPILARFGWLI